VKFRVEREPFGEAVSFVARALATRPVVPVLAGILVHADDDKVTLSCFDYEVSARAVVAAEVQEPGAELVPGRLIAEIVRNLPPQPIEVTSSAGMVVLTCGSAEFALVSLPLEEYPSLPEQPPAVGAVDGGALASAAAQVVPSASHDDTLPMLTGVCLDFDGAAMTLAATDRYRLAVRTLSWQPVDPDVKASVLVPARTLAEVARTMAAGRALTISFRQEATDRGSGSASPPDGMISFEGGGRRLTARLIGSEFIRYRSRFPIAFDCTAELAPAPFIEAVRRVSLVAERTTPVQLAFKRDIVVIEARTDGRARGVESVPARFSGPEQVISFNPQYLLDGLAAAAVNGQAKTADEVPEPSGRIRLEFTSPAKPAVISWADQDEAAAGHDPFTAGNEPAGPQAVTQPASQEPVSQPAGTGAASFRYLVVPLRVPVPG
jgi:DNA polymerase III subunit beta